MIWVARVFTHGDVVFKREAGETRSSLDTGSQIEIQKAKKILYNVQKAFWKGKKTKSPGSLNEARLFCQCGCGMV